MLSKEERDALVFKHEKLIKYIIKTHFPKMVRSQEYEDLVQVGYEALVMAASRFDEDKDVKFNSFAQVYVEGSIRKYFRDHSLIRLSRTTRICMGQIFKIASNKGIEVDEIGLEHLKEIEFTDEIKTEALSFLNLKLMPVMNQDEADEGYGFIQIEDKNCNTEAKAMNQIIIDDIIKFLYNKYTGTKAQILEDYLFTLMYENEEINQKELGKRYGKSQMTVSRTLRDFKMDLKKEFGDIFN